MLATRKQAMPETVMTAWISHSQFHQIVFYVTLTVCFAPELYRSWFRRLEAGAVNRDRGSHLVVLLTIGAGVFLAIFVANARLPYTQITWYQESVFWLGIALMLTGFAFRHYAIHVLGRFFTHTVATRPGQYVVDTGPYRLIRHPSYSGSLLTFVGLGLAMGNWVSIVLLLLGAGIGYAYRVRIEEQTLCTDLGQPYRDYMLRTKRFVPHVW